MIEVVKEFLQSFSEDWRLNRYMHHFALARTIKKDIVLRLFVKLTINMVGSHEVHKSGTHISSQDLKEHPTVKFFGEITDLFIFEDKLTDRTLNCPEEIRDYFRIDDFGDGKQIISAFKFMISFIAIENPKKRMYYSPESLNLETIHFHLWVLLIYYSFQYDIVPAHMDILMDIALAQLSSVVTALIEGANVLSKDRIRLQKAYTSKSNNIKERHQDVRKFYNQIDSYGRKPYAIAKLIQEKMSKKSLKFLP